MAFFTFGKKKVARGNPIILPEHLARRSKSHESTNYLCAMNGLLSARHIVERIKNVPYLKTLPKIKKKKKNIPILRICVNFQHNSFIDLKVFNFLFAFNSYVKSRFCSIYLQI